MPIMNIILENHKMKISFTLGMSVKDIVDSTELRIRAYCQGIGACGLCRVQIVEGKCNPPSLSEKIHLSRAELDENYRLACQTYPKENVTITNLALIRNSSWQSSSHIHGWLPDYPIKQPANPSSSSKSGDLTKNRYGLAIDIGTTHMNLTILNLLTNQRLFQRYGLNPQIHYGTDVISRLMHAKKIKGPCRSTQSSYH